MGMGTNVGAKTDTNLMKVLMFRYIYKDLRLSVQFRSH